MPFWSEYNTLTHQTVMVYWADTDAQEVYQAKSMPYYFLYSLGLIRNLGGLY